jgi:hypothetical protein
VLSCALLIKMIIFLVSCGSMPRHHAGAGARGSSPAPTSKIATLVERLGMHPSAYGVIGCSLRGRHHMAMRRTLKCWLDLVGRRPGGCVGSLQDVPKTEEQ